MYKTILLSLIVLLSGCSLRLPITIEPNSSIVITNKEHIPNTDGVLQVKIKGYRYSFLPQPMIQPTTQPTTQPKGNMAPIKIDPIFDFFDFQKKKSIAKQEVNVSGTGFVVAKLKDHYYVITARHVVLVPEPTVFVDGQKGEIVSISSKVDIAILKFKSKKIYPVYKMTDKAEVLETTWIAGFPGDIFEVKRKFVIKGSICNVSKSEVWFSGGGAQGMSGGPLLNRKNEVIGTISRFLSSIQPCDNFIKNVPSRYFSHEIKAILLKEEIKQITKRIEETVEKINILKKL